MELNTNPAGMVSKTEYGDAGNVKLRTQGFGTTDALATSYTYDAKGRQKTVTSPSGGVPQITTTTAAETRLAVKMRTAMA